ncbi:unnamed protein product [Agarophyton chilense]
MILFPYARLVAAVFLLLVAVVFHFVGQLVSVISWKTAIRLGLQDASAPPEYYPYEHGIAIADVLLGWTYPIAAIGLLLNQPWAFKLAWIPASVLVYHSLSAWFWEADRRAAGHQLMSDSVRIIWCGANFFTGLLTIFVAWIGPADTSATVYRELGTNYGARMLGNSLICVMTVYVLFLTWWQTQVLAGRKMTNPDGSADDWHAQKTHFGIAFADVCISFPVCIASAIGVVMSLRWGYFGYSLIAMLFVWGNVMTTATSLRFHKPRLTFEWFVTFPFGLLLGFAYLVWMIVCFDALVGV